MFFYNLMIGISLREKAYLYYCGYVLTLSLLVDKFERVRVPVYLARVTGTFHNHVIAGSVGLAFMMACIFSREFLKTRELLPRTDKVLLFGMYSSVLSIRFCFAWPTFILAVRIRLFSCTLLLPMFLVAGNHLPGQRLQGGPFLCFFLGHVCYRRPHLLSKRLWGFFPYNEFSKWSAQVGTGLEATLISFALADRIKILATEKENAELK